MKKVFISFIFLFGLFFVIDDDKAYAAEIVGDPLIDGFSTVTSKGVYIYDFPDGYHDLTGFYIDVKGKDAPLVTLYGKNGDIMTTRIDGISITPSKYPESYNGTYKYFVPLKYQYINRISISVLSSSATVVTDFQIFGVKSDQLPDDVPPSNISNFSYKFDEDLNLTLEYDFPSDKDFSYLKIYKNGELIQDNYKKTNLKLNNISPFESNQFKIVSVDTSGNESSGFIQTVVAPDGPDFVAPANISNLKPVVSGQSIDFSYSLPNDLDFSHLQIYRNNELLIENHKLSTFKDIGLTYETEYSYIFKSVDNSGNVSDGKYISVTTSKEVDLTPPDVPTGFKIKSANSGLYLSWFPNSESDVSGYNVYLDGEKYNSSLVFGNSFNIVNLTNANEYKVSISAVDTSGNESEKTPVKIGIPDNKEMPIVTINNNLQDVATSTENWFSELWYVAAFAIAIPLSFLIAMRVKGLFIA